MPFELGKAGFLIDLSAKKGKGKEPIGLPGETYPIVETISVLFAA